MSDIISSSIGLIANAVLIYLILTAKKENKNHITLVLLQNCILDSFLAIFYFLALPQFVIINGVFYNIIGSPFRFLGYSYASFVICLCGAGLQLSIMAMAIPFYIRYLVLCGNGSITRRDVIKPYILVLCLIIFVCWTCFNACPMFENIYEKFRDTVTTPFWLEEYPDGPTFVAIENTDPRLFLIFGTMGLLTCVSYTFVVYFIIKITKHLRENSSSMSEKTKALNKQLHYTMMIQAVVPLFTANIPMSIQSSMVLLKYEHLYTSLICCCLFGWIAVLNPLAAMIMVKSYRNRILSVFGLTKQEITQVSKTSVGENRSKSFVSTVLPSIPAVKF